jgi:class 3 adenylate cyclase
MVDDARPGAGTAAYRGFLFADLRGFTAFAERQGNTAAAAAVTRFLEITRRAIARHAGAETKTEGDAIHAVFPSASSAVLCGLDIVEGAAELSAREADLTIPVGVGVHAGEAIETAEGYIGRAVNIAARLCAAAKPGEVLVSSTVKGIAQSSIPVGFIPRGRRRLKGIQDPIVVYAVTRDTTVRAAREMPRPLLIGSAAVAVVAVLAIAALLGSRFLQGSGAGASASGALGSGAPSEVAPSTQPVVIGPLGVGTYQSQEFQPTITFDIHDLDWSAHRNHPELLGLIREAQPFGSLYAMRVQEVITSPCVDQGEGAQTGLGAVDVIGQLAAIDHLTLTNRAPIEVGGFEGEKVDVIVDQGALIACGGLTGGEVSVFVAGEEVWRAATLEQFQVVAINVDGQPVTFVLSIDWSKSQAAQELVDLLEAGWRILDSVEF